VVVDVEMGKIIDVGMGVGAHINVYHGSVHMAQGLGFRVKGSSV
jgi:hypothetical protein